MIDISLSTQAFFLAYLIRFNFTLDFGNFDLIAQLPLVALASLLGFLMIGSFKGIVRHTGTKDAINVFWAATTIAALLFTTSLVTRGYDIFPEYFIPLSIVSIHYLLNIVILISSRFIFKFLFDRIVTNYQKPKNVMIYGAGDSGLITYSTLTSSKQKKYKVVGFLDDSVHKIGKQFNRIKIFDPKKIDERFIKKHGVEDIIVSIQKIKPYALFERVDSITHLPVRIKLVPPMEQWIDGELNLGQIKDVQIDDLLDRSPIVIDNPVLKKHLNEKVILVTGAAGSIGSEIAEQISRYQYKKLILLDQAESALYDLQQGFLRKRVQNFEIELADIRNQDRLKDLFESHSIDIIFHAAAYKHVPLMESNPYEAVRVNVYGSSLLMQMAIKHSVEKFIMVSTDKAVNPTNVMGATKRVAEIYANCLNTQGKTKFVTTRFGNVLGSNGSVIPLFERQIKNGGPITVTHKEITRFFMTIPEACQLVLEAGVMGNGGEIYVFDMGESVKIYELAKKMIHLSGLRYPEDIDIHISGLRPGEKLYEELLTNEENTIPTHHEKIMIARTENIHVDNLRAKIEDLIASQNLGHVEIVKRLKAIVPEYVSNNSEYEQLDGDRGKVKKLKIS
jgi:FlaA1/EpsC-like NDP-sugar epimerase